MRSLSRRFGIAALSVALVGTLLGSTQAGIIPWVYDVIFGPVGYGHQPYGYPPMAMGYGCGPCRAPMQMACRPAPYSPCSTSRCSTGSCPTVVSYGPRASCETGREVTRWKSGETSVPESQEVTKRTPSPVDPAPAPKKTFAAGAGAAADSAAAGTVESTDAVVSKPETLPSDVNKPATAIVAPPAAGGLVTPEPAVTPGDSPGFVTTPADESDATATPPGTGSDPFVPPTPGTVPPPAETGTKAPVLPGPSLPEPSALPDEVKEPAGVDGQASWKLTVPTRRLARRATYRNAQIARRITPVDADYVIPSESVTRIVSRD